VFAQIDSSTRFFGEKPASYELIRVAPKKDFSTNIESILNLEEINKKLEEKNQKDNTNFLKETLPDKEIIGLKYWKGEDVTHKKLESNESLGELYTKSNILRVVFRDFGAIDGDIIKLYLNEKSLRYNIDLRSGGFSYYFELKEGYNRLDFKALNQGTLGPNTAELQVYDTKDVLLTQKEWNLNTNETATLGIVKQ
jgi:hypothetical protein